MEKSIKEQQGMTSPSDRKIPYKPKQYVRNVPDSNPSSIDGGNPNGKPKQYKIDPSNPNYQERDPKLLTDDTENTNICLNVTKDKCPSRSCKNHHLPSGITYLWQIKMFGKWLSFTVTKNELIETAFCLFQAVASTEMLYKQMKYRLHIFFSNPMHGVIYDIDGQPAGDDYTCVVRRLSTPSFAERKMNTDCYLTQWRWYWKDDNQTWIKYDKDSFQFTLEKKFLTKQETYLFPDNNYFMYRIDFSKMTQVKLDFGKERQIIRRPLFVSKTDVEQNTFPEQILFPAAMGTAKPTHFFEWDCAHDFELVELDTNEREYLDVRASFYATMDAVGYKVRHIYRIQNRRLWSAYETKRKQMKANAEQHGKAVDERDLFQGTDSWDKCRSICTNNFDFRTSARNATLYGEGSYFAVHAKFSHSYTKADSPTDLRFMFRAKVLLGQFSQESPDFRRPPEIPGKGHKLYDYSVDKAKDPQVFTVFDRDQCYPDYLFMYTDNDTISTETISSKSEVQPLSYPHIADIYTSTQDLDIISDDSDLEQQPLPTRKAAILFTELDAKKAEHFRQHLLVRQVEQNKPQIEVTMLPISRSDSDIQLEKCRSILATSKMFIILTRSLKLVLISTKHSLDQSWKRCWLTDIVNKRNKYIMVVYTAYCKQKNFTPDFMRACRSFRLYEPYENDDDENLCLTEFIYHDYDTTETSKNVPVTSVDYKYPQFDSKNETARDNLPKQLPLKPHFLKIDVKNSCVIIHVEKDPRHKYFEAVESILKRDLVKYKEGSQRSSIFKTTTAQLTVTLSKAQSKMIIQGKQENIYYWMENIFIPQCRKLEITEIQASMFRPTDESKSPQKERKQPQKSQKQNRREQNNLPVRRRNEKQKDDFLEPTLGHDSILRKQKEASTQKADISGGLTRAKGIGYDTSDEEWKPAFSGKAYSWPNLTYIYLGYEDKLQGKSGIFLANTVEVPTLEEDEHTLPHQGKGQTKTDCETQLFGELTLSKLQKENKLLLRQQAKDLVAETEVLFKETDDFIIIREQTDKTIEKWEMDLLENMPEKSSISFEGHHDIYLLNKKPYKQDWFYKLHIQCNGFQVHAIIDSNLEQKYDTLQNFLTRHETLLNMKHDKQGVSSDFVLLYTMVNRIIPEMTVSPIDCVDNNREMVLRFLLGEPLPLGILRGVLEHSVKVKKKLMTKSLCWCVIRQLKSRIEKYIENKTIKDIWPVFICECKTRNVCSESVQIAIEIENENEYLPEKLGWIPIAKVCKYKSGNQKEDKYLYSRTINPNCLKPRKVTSSEDAQALFESHSNLTLVYTDLNMKNGKEFVHLFCKGKGLIPVGESHLPDNIEDIRTKISEGSVSFLTKLTIGNGIGNTNSGTLGGYVKFFGMKTILTCAHVVHDQITLLAKCKKVKHEDTTNVYSVDSGVCIGNVIYSVFDYGEKGETSVDAALVLVKLDNPAIMFDEQNVIIDKDGQAQPPGTIGMTSAYLQDCYVDYKKVRGSLTAKCIGAVSKHFEGNVNYICPDESRDNPNEPAGIAIEWEKLTKRLEKIIYENPRSQFMSDSAHLQHVGTILEKKERSERRFVTFYNQLLIPNVPFQQGDSGMCIYITNNQTPDYNETGCLGMAIANLDDKCIVTPIEPILKKLGVL